MAGFFANGLSEVCCNVVAVLQICTVDGDPWESAERGPEAAEGSGDMGGVYDAAICAVNRRKDTAETTAGPHQRGPSLRSLGWMLPLRM